MVVRTLSKIALLKKSLVAAMLFFLLLVSGYGYLNCAFGGEGGKPDISITAYTGAASLVYIEKHVPLKAGENRVELDVPGSFEPDSIFLESENAQISNYRFKSAITSESQLLKAQVGRKITAISCSDESCEKREGELLSVINGNPLLETDSGLTVLLKHVTSYQFPELDIRKTRPLLETYLVSEEEVQEKLSFGYRTSAISWHPVYVALLDEVEEEIDLTGTAKLSNETGLDFSAVDLSLVAGEPKEPEKNMFARSAEALPLENSVSLDQLFEYHVYRIGEPISISSSETLSLPFIRREGIPIDKSYIYRRASDPGVLVQVSLINDSDSGLGIPLPAGKVQFYNREHGLKFLGQDSIPNLPAGEEFTLSVGRAYDVTAEATRLSHEKLGDGHWRDEVQLTFTNGKEESIDLSVIERLPGSWTILEASEPHSKLDGNRVKFQINAQSGATTEITYVVEYRY